MHLFIVHDRKRPRRAVCVSLAFRIRSRQIRLGLAGRANVDFFALFVEWLKLSQIADRFRQNHRAEFAYDDAVIEAVRSRCREVESGARNVDHILTGKLLPEISRQILGRMAEGLALTRAAVSVVGGGEFKYSVE